MTSSKIVKKNAAMTGDTENHVKIEKEFAKIKVKGSLSNQTRGTYWTNMMVARTKSAV